MFQIHVKFNICHITQEHSETQLHTVRVAGTSQQKRWVSLSIRTITGVWTGRLVLLGLLAFGDCPFYPTYGAMISFLKLTPMGIMEKLRKPYIRKSRLYGFAEHQSLFLIKRICCKSH